MRSMTWLNVYDFASNGDLLGLTVALNIESLETDILLAPIIKFLKGA